jgi:hypothetical protein
MNWRALTYLLPEIYSEIKRTPKIIMNIHSLLALVLVTLAMLSCRQRSSTPTTQRAAESVTLKHWSAGHVDRATKVWFRLTATAIEVRWECDDDFISTPLTGRDSDLYKGDAVELFIDPAGDGRNLVEIQVNPNNDVLDLLLRYAEGYEVTETGRLTEASVQSHFQSDRPFNVEGLQTSAGRSSKGYWVKLQIPVPALCRAAGLDAVNPGRIRWNLVRLDHQQDGRVVQTDLVRVDPGCQHISPRRTTPLTR